MISSVVEANVVVASVVVEVVVGTRRGGQGVGAPVNESGVISGISCPPHVAPYNTHTHTRYETSFNCNREYI